MQSQLERRNLRMNLILIIFAVTIYRPLEAWIIPQPPTNVWVTLAKALNQDHLCLSTSSAANPFLSCLVGIPYPLDHLPFNFPNTVPTPRNRSTKFQSVQLKVPHEWRVWYQSLPVLNEEPQAISLLGSALAYTCVQFFITTESHPIVKSRSYFEIKQTMKEYTTREWCLKVIQIDASTNYDEQPRKLPKGTFFLCGNRAWAGIPSRLLGGPCTFGQLTLFTPNKTQIAHWQEVNSTGNLARSKRDTNFKNLDEDCNNEIFHWNQTKSVLITTFIPWWSIAQSLNELKGLEVG
nr:uncharacterized protein LOC121469240 [Taeniopygia guttata]